MKLFYAPGACSIGIHVLMEELGKPYDGVAVSLRDGAQFKPEFTSVNPGAERTSPPVGPNACSSPITASSRVNAITRI